MFRDQWTVTDPDTVVPFAEPDTETVLDAVTLEVFTVKATLVLPAGIIALAGTNTVEELLESTTLKPPTGAIEPNVTVPVADRPPLTVAGFTASDLSTGGLMVNTELFETPFKVEVMVTVVTLPTAST